MAKTFKHKSGTVRTPVEGSFEALLMQHDDAWTPLTQKQAKAEAKKAGDGEG